MHLGATCAFWGLMRFGEVAVTTRAAFNPAKHLTRGDVFSARDQDGQPYARLDLPAAKTAKHGDIQSVFLVQQGDLCPLEALRILAAVPAARKRGRPAVLMEGCQGNHPSDGQKEGHGPH